MRAILITILFGLSGITQAKAQKLFTSSGSTRIFVDEVLLVPIDATNAKTTAILDLDKMQVAALMQIQNFDFPNNLMEEHFNENYMLTHKYPKAFFEGKIEGLDASSEEQQDVVIKGILTIKGVSKTFESQAIAKKTGGNLDISGSFKIHPTEFEVDLPKIMFTPVFESVIVKFEYSLEPQAKE